MTTVPGHPPAPLAPPAPIDPLAPVSGGVYRDDLVEVRTIGPGTARRERHMTRTPSFDLLPTGGRITVVHRIPAERIDDDLAGLIAAELFTPGWLRGAEVFERIFTGVVRTAAPDALASWELFYRNTLARIEEAVGGAPEPPGRGSHGTIAGYAPVYAHAEELLRAGSVLELGSCFGFLSLRIAASGRPTVASDVSAGTMRLLAAMAPRLGVALTARVADAARVCVPDRSADTVLAVHLLEHVDEAHGDRVIDEAVRLAARRVVVAVPLEDEADETWGHLRTVSLDDLDRWGRRTGLPYDVHEHHGGWLVVDVA